MASKVQFARYSAIVLFGLFGLQGIWGSLNQMAQCDTLGKSLQTLALFGYGGVGLVIAFRVMMKKPRLYIIEAIWSVCIVLAAGVAPSVWGSAPIITSFMSALAAAVIIAGGLWLLRISRVAP